MQVVNGASPGFGSRTLSPPVSIGGTQSGFCGRCATNDPVAARQVRLTQAALSPVEHCFNTSSVGGSVSAFAHRGVARFAELLHDRHVAEPFARQEFLLRLKLAVASSRTGARRSGA